MVVMWLTGTPASASAHAVGARSRAMWLRAGVSCAEVAAASVGSLSERAPVQLREQGAHAVVGYAELFDGAGGDSPTRAVRRR